MTDPRFPPFVQEWIELQGIRYVTPGLLEDEALDWESHACYARMEGHTELAEMSRQRAAEMREAAATLRVRGAR